MVGATKQHVATAFYCNVSTVSQGEQATGRVRDRGQPRQPRVTTIRRDQQVRVNHLRNETATQISRQTKGVMGKCPRVLTHHFYDNHFTLRFDVHV